MIAHHFLNLKSRTLIFCDGIMYNDRRSFFKRVLMKFFILFFLIQSLSTFASVEKEFRNFIANVQTKNNLCKDQVSTILKKAYRDDEKTPEGQENYKFIENEQEAIKLARSLDLKKITFEENSRVKGFLYKNCSADSNIDEFQECDYYFDLYSYHRALAHAVKNYSWSQKSKAEAIQHIRKYLEIVSTAYTNLLDKSMAIDVLNRLDEQGFLEEKSKNLVKELAKESEAISEKLRKRSRSDLKTFDVKKRTCGIAYASFEEELAEAKRLGTHFQEVLKKIVFK